MVGAVVTAVELAVEECLKVVGEEVPERTLLVLNSCVAGNDVTRSSACTIPAQGASTMLFPHTSHYRGVFHVTLRINKPAFLTFQNQAQVNAYNINAKSIKT